MAKGYNTEQKRRLLAFLESEKERHFTIDELLIRLEAAGCPIARSTLYRQMSALYNEGAVRRFESSGMNSFVYQFAGRQDDCDHHFHLKCAVCGKLLHMECSELERVREHIKAEHGFLMGSHRSVIYGECADCVGKG